ncbi:MAG: hypothetical protein RIR91_2061 [Verrucomicrobiota bacterium]
MPRAVCIINVAHEGPGLIGELLLQRGYAVELVQAWQGERLPDDLGATDLLVVMGGPMGVADIGRPETPWLGPVAALLRRRLAAGWPNLGICLGCQLIAHAAGAVVAPMRDASGQRVREVGWGSCLRLAGRCRLAGLDGRLSGPDVPARAKHRPPVPS